MVGEIGRYGTCGHKPPPADLVRLQAAACNEVIGQRSTYTEGSSGGIDTEKPVRPSVSLVVYKGGDDCLSQSRGSIADALLDLRRHRSALALARPARYR